MANCQEELTTETSDRLKYCKPRLKGIISVLILSLACSCVVDICSANLNVYLSQSEVKRLLGLTAELFYVREGVINEYALNFIVPVPAAIPTLHFTWQSLMGQPLPYVIEVEVSDLEALGNPALNVSLTGYVPTVPQTFRVSLPCTGNLNAEVDVTLYINVTIQHSPRNVTALVFRRRKICLKDTFADNHVVVVDSPGESSSGLIFYIAIGCAFAIIFVIVVMVSTYYVRNNKIRRQGEMLQESRNGSASSAQGHATFLTVDTPLPNNTFSGTSASSCKSGASYASFKRLPSYSLLDERVNKDIHERIAELTIQRCRVRLRSVVLEGTFGRVYRGSYNEEEVLVKTVTDHASQVQVSLLLQEGMAMYGVTHKNVLSVLGVSIEDHTAPFLIYPYQGYTNLKRFLQKCKLCPEGVAHTLTTQEVVDMAIQIAQGIQFLHKRRLVHRDIAARNCVVDDKLRVKVTDNALSRDLFPADYHCLGDNENRPIKWLAIESLLHGTFSAASDVWAFGVLLWELTTLAQQPYAEVDPFEMAAYLRDGYRLVQPVNCPDELFAVMAYCWAMSGDDRPTFTQLLVCLQEFYTQLTRYV
ncbi:tyrosine-protein kinase Dnt [Anabrus simplex]|uniref:tyrosine-protein kinase Dnt n=1 Tax=Anabrus simplex TaxID=316456 RepID=UPI0035A374D6